MYTMKLSSLFTSTILKAKYISRWMREPRHIGFQRSQKRILIRYGYFSLCRTIVSAFLIHELVERIQSGDVAKKVSSMKWKNFSWISQVIGSTSLTSKQIGIYKLIQVLGSENSKTGQSLAHVLLQLFQTSRHILLKEQLLEPCPPGHQVREVLLR